MSELPFCRVEPAEFGSDGIGNGLNRVEEVASDGSRGLSLVEKTERVWLARYVISKVKIRSIMRAKVVAIPVKGRRTNFPVDLEELIDLFPS